MIRPGDMKGKGGVRLSTIAGRDSYVSSALTSQTQLTQLTSSQARHFYSNVFVSPLSPAVTRMYHLLYTLEDVTLHTAHTNTFESTPASFTQTQTHDPLALFTHILIINTYALIHALTHLCTFINKNISLTLLRSFFFSASFRYNPRMSSSPLVTAGKGKQAGYVTQSVY